MKLNIGKLTKKLLILFSLFLFTNCKSTEKFKNEKQKFNKLNVTEVTFDMYRYGMGITFSIKNKDSIRSFITDLNHSEIIEFKKKPCKWDEIIIKNNGKDYVIKTNGEIFTSDSIKKYYKLNEKYLKHWDGYEICK